jgi:hypothetical protein
MAVTDILMGGYVIVPGIFILAACKFCEERSERNLASMECVDLST